MQRWEYACIAIVGQSSNADAVSSVAGFQVKRFPVAEAILDDLGKDGWELVAIQHSNGAFVLKRPLPDIPAPEAENAAAVSDLSPRQPLIPDIILPFQGGS